MKNAATLGKALVALGVVILLALAASHFYAAAHHQVQSFDEYGYRVAIPFFGAVSLTTGVFLLALSGGNRNV